MAFLSKFFDSNEKQVKKMLPLVEEINRLEKDFEALTEEQIKAKTESFKDALKDIKTPEEEKIYLDKILPEAFALVREASKRTIKQRHFDVQLMAGTVLHQGAIAEQRTGEGKTLTATLPLYLNSLTGKGCHLVTPNDYLSRHGAGWMGRIYNYLGVSVGVIIHEEAFLYDPTYENNKFMDEYAKNLRPVSRAEAYSADITYGTNNEFGFDYLRDNMVYDLSQMCQTNARKDFGAHHFAIVDEVDFILIDEARTPLIISAPAEESTEKYYKVASLIEKLVRDTDYKLDEKERTAVLTEIGISKLEKMLGVDNLYEKDFETVRLVEQALKAIVLFRKDRDYIVKDGEVIIVDEFTGRLMPGRRYSEGLHQAIEAKEGVKIQRESKTLATISFQNYFRMYEKLSGMTGTAATEAEELAKIYNLDVMVIPTHRKNVRKDHSDVVYKSQAAKFKAIVEDIAERFQKGQPVLVGTTSVENNEMLHEFLKRKQIPHEVLNAKNHEREALIIAQAGRKGAITVATNMAGRGVDIILGGDPPDPKEQEEVLAAGGLYVLGTERHEARRIDNQLRGRAGRQGDPGESRFYVSLQDDLMRIFGGDQVASLMTRMGLDESVPMEAGLVSRSIESSQKKVEGFNFDIRKHLVEYDDVMNKQRQVIYRLRNKLLEALSFPETSLKEYLLPKIAGYSEELNSIWEDQAKKLGETWERVVAQISLQTIDALWMEHLETMQDLREGVGLRSYANKDPLVEYQRDGRIFFEQLLVNMYATITDRLVRLRLEGEEKIAVPEVKMETKQMIFEHKEADLGVSDEVRAVASAPVQNQVGDIGRNDKCWCGSGKKYKKCHLGKDPKTTEERKLFEDFVKKKSI
ncbi:preprotein translocase subunit SecA [candidate division WWE3 bacterium CG08_land_8_20_14_0_20_41_15]|uniref:Protein translocase subunit SecA n=1 Tax=candidate division WWE3 bacterium CG08_land_8_20_14_0_20_41_15 TaxID=1975086 RepID=A0A2H0XA04_UNCKA|nr:MAG: preprotein translocase subunit SecA [candidate division WWE3 bacterium CG08_land_8_20_14_0_20_41_15]